LPDEEATARCILFREVPVDQKTILRCGIVRFLIVATVIFAAFWFGISLVAGSL
jgi:hypothetical protein